MVMMLSSSDTSDHTINASDETSRVGLEINAVHAACPGLPHTIWFLCSPVTACKSVAGTVVVATLEF